MSVVAEEGPGDFGNELREDPERVGFMDALELLVELPSPRSEIDGRKTQRVFGWPIDQT